MIRPRHVQRANRLHSRKACARTLGLVIVLSAARLWGGIAMPTVAAAYDDCVHARTAINENTPIRGCGKAAWTKRVHALRRHEAEREAIAQQRGRWGPFLPEQRGSQSPDETDLLHCDLDIEIGLHGGPMLRGTNTMTLVSLVDGLTTFTFRLRMQYEITEATFNGVEPVVVNDLSITSREAVLPYAVQEGEQFTLTIAYRGVPVDVAGAISFGAQDENGHDAIWTLSEPYFSYAWWPVKDGNWGLPGDNSDKFTMTTSITAPDDMQSASNGLLTSVDLLSGNRKRYNWATNYPMSTYLACLASSNYVQFEATYETMSGDSMPVFFWIYPEDDTPENRARLNDTISMLEVFSQLFGEYPFVEEKYGIYQFGFGGGMEHQTFTGQGSFQRFLTAHELAHQWFGDAITCKTWNDLWLNEGFASYAEALWFEFQPGSSGLTALKDYMNEKRYFGAGTVYVQNDELDDVNEMFNGGTTYDKAAWVVHMLRHVLGDETFFDMIAGYRAMYEGSAASTADFIEICEQYDGRPLDWFFDQWVFGERVPNYEYSWAWLDLAEGPYLELLIDQVQNESYQRFTMPLDVAVDGVVYKVFNDADREHYLIPMPAGATPPTSVVLDPDDWVLAFGHAEPAHTAGPPKIVSIEPAPDSVTGTAVAPAEVRMAFSRPVSMTADDFQLVGAEQEDLTPTFTFDPAGMWATLGFSDGLQADQYTLVVFDSIVGGENHLALDGEVSADAGYAALPSGDGLPGGVATVYFNVVPSGACCSEGVCSDVTRVACAAFVCNVADHLPGSFTGCYGDADGSGVINASDRGFVSANIGQTGDVEVCLFDLDGNGVITPSDRGFISANDGQCEPLPDFMNGSGLNHGQPDTRFVTMTYMGDNTLCSEVTCP